MYLSKNELRKNFLLLRKKLSREEIEYKSNSVILKLKSFINFDFNVISGYVPINNEVDILPYIKELYDNDKSKILLFPKIINNEISMFKINDFYNDFVKGKYNIPEPNTIEYLDFIDIVLIPGVVFGKNGYRIGYGKGYYDRFLIKNKNRIKYKIGISYDFQLTKEIPHNENDQKLDYIISESEIIRITNE